MMAKRKRLLYENNVKSAIRLKKLRKILLSDLPEEILQIVMSHLTLKDAARMSTLSRMWKTLWKSHSNLCFDGAMITNSHAQRNQGFIQDSRSVNEKKFIDIVNAVLHYHSGANLNQFKLAFELCGKHGDSLDNWIGFAVLSKASQLVLDLDPKLLGITEDAYDFPFHLFQSETSIQSLSIASVSLKPPCNFHGFMRLKKLNLRHVRIMEDIGNLLSNCSVLEWLHIVCCHFEKLKMHGTCHRLKYLCIRSSELQAIQLHATDLVTFEYRGKPLSIVFEVSPELKMADIKLVPYNDDFGYVCSGLPKSLPLLVDLYLDVFIRTEMPHFVTSNTKFNYLRYVNCMVDVYGSPENASGILRLASLLEFAPVLHKLELHMTADMFPSRFVEVCCNHRSSPHNHLKIVRITGFVGFRGQIEFAMYILENAHALQSMTIDPFSLHQCRSEKDVCRSLDVKVGREYAHRFLDREKFRDILTIL